MKILYIGSKISKAQSGADQVNMRNQLLLEGVAEVKYISIDETKGAKIFLSVGRKLLMEIERELTHNNYDYIFIQQSTLGRACAYIKKHFPQVKIILFFHNIELQYANEYLKTNGLRAIPFYLTVKYWEKIACKYSDIHITLNSRDQDLLRQMYRVKADLNLPTSMIDKYSDEKALTLQKMVFQQQQDVIDYLFVGVAFFANIEAVQWFIDNVLPFVEGHLCVVGKGMDRVRFKNLNSRVHIHGFVDDLSDFYYRSKIVVSPINVGGGMKTKTAEALMYGKTIIGTSEAFQGYELNEKCTIMCNSAQEFINAIKMIDSDKQLINEDARSLFLEYYENSILLKKLSTFLIQQG